MIFYNEKSSPLVRCILSLVLLFWVVDPAITVHAKPTEVDFSTVPDDYVDEAAQIPAFWVATVDEVNDFLKNNVRKGQVEVIGTSAGGRPISAVSYGKARDGSGTTTFSGSLALGEKGTAAYRGKDSEKTVYIGLAGVHGFELEGIVGAINLINIFETGKDIAGESWPELVTLLDKVDRIVIIPLLNPDGRARVPVRMEKYRGEAPDAYTIHEYLNTGGKKDGSLFGWPEVKEFIPMDFTAVGFPGGYPNGAGVNLMHDDFFGKLQPETRALFALCAKEKPDLLLSMHTGVWVENYFMAFFRPLLGEAALQPVFNELYRRIMTGLTKQGLRGSTDISVETNVDSVLPSGYNLDTALNLHCGVLAITVESPSHGYGGRNRAGESANQTPKKLLQAQLIAHQEALRFLVEQGARENWGSLAPNRH